MKTLSQLQGIIDQNWAELQSSYKVARLGFFGSYARGQQREDSDVDVLVEFQEPVGFLFVHLADRLEELLGLPVDLVTPDAIRPNRRELIFGDLVDVKA
jgi:predicted nucleotidyltransferase